MNEKNDWRGTSVAPEPMQSSPSAQIILYEDIHEEAPQEPAPPVNKLHGQYQVTSAADQLQAHSNESPASKLHFHKTSGNNQRGQYREGGNNHHEQYSGTSADNNLHGQYRETSDNNLHGQHRETSDNNHDQQYSGTFDNNHHGVYSESSGNDHHEIHDHHQHGQHRETYDVHTPYSGQNFIAEDHTPGMEENLVDPYSKHSSSMMIKRVNNHIPTTDVNYGRSSTEKYLPGVTYEAHNPHNSYEQYRKDTYGFNEENYDTASEVEDPEEEMHYESSSNHAQERISG